MKEPKWIKWNVVEFIHHILVKEFGGLEGVRDENILQQSLMAPNQMFHYANPKPSIVELAARYAFSLTKNHPFNDGNKRTAWMITLIFLEDNGYESLCSKEEAYLIMVDLAANTITDLNFLDWLQHNVRKK